MIKLKVKGPDPPADSHSQMQQNPQDEKLGGINDTKEILEHNKKDEEPQK